MTTSDFAQRHGYREEHPVFKSPDFLPQSVREQAGVMVVASFEKLMTPSSNAALAIRDGFAWPYREAYRWFADVVRDALPPSEDLWNWYQGVIHSVLESRTAGRKVVRGYLVGPLVRCDWRIFYEVIEKVCEEISSPFLSLPYDFVSDFNLMLQAHGIPWILRDGLVIPAADREFAEELKHAREVAHPPTADHVSDPHMLIRDALAALYRKQGGPDLSAACVHAWAAWKAAAGAASGFGARDRRTFEFVSDEYPALGLTMKAWQKLAEGGRHPETGAPLTESETRFIVMLCVNAVRLLCPTCRSEDEGSE